MQSHYALVFKMSIYRAIFTSTIAQKYRNFMLQSFSESEKNDRLFSPLQISMILMYLETLKWHATQQ